MLRLFILSTILLSSMYSEDYVQLESIPIQEEGRIKPFDTFARNQLLRFYGKRSTGTDISPVEWLLGIATDKLDAIEIPIFNIRNSEVAYTLGLDWNSEHKYTISEVSSGIESELDIFKSIYSKEEENLSLVEKQLAEIYTNVAMYKSIESSLSCLLPIVLIDNQKIADAIKVKLGEKVSYFRFIV